MLTLFHTTENYKNEQKIYPDTPNVATLLYFLSLSLPPNLQYLFLELFESKVQIDPLMHSFPDDAPNDTFWHLAPG